MLTQDHSSMPARDETVRLLNAALLIDTLTGGGAERVVQQLALGLSRRGHGAAIYCLKAAGCDTRELAGAGVTVREAESHGKDFGLVGRLVRWMRQDHIDVVHAHGSAAFCWGLPAAKRLGLPIILTRHGAHLGKRNFYPRWADRLIGLASRVTIVAESLRDDIPSRRIARRAIHLPNGVDCEPIPPADARRELERLCGNAPRGPIVLSLGTISPEKDTLALIEAFALVRLDFPRARLVVIGGERGAQYAAEVRRLVRLLGLDDRVHFLGHVDQAWRLIAGADVFCQSSRTEAMPIALLEAMSQAAPIVATTVGEVGRLDNSPATASMLLRHRETALLTPPARPRQLAAALVETLNDAPAARARARKAADEYRHNHTSEMMTRRYEGVYTDCTGRPRAGAVTSTATTFCPKPVVVMLGPAPPRIGGMVTSIELLLQSPLCEQFEPHRLGTTTAPEYGRRSDRPSPWRRNWQRVAAITRHGLALCGLARELIRRRTSILHIHTCSYFTFYRNLLDLAVAKILGRKVILHIRGGRFEQFHRESGRLGRWLIRRGLEAADAVIVLSQSWHDALKPFAGRARLFVVPNAFDPEALPTPHDISEARRQRAILHDGVVCRFLYMAPVREAKGVGDLIEAARALRDSGTRFELCIAGPAADGDEARWLRQARDAALEGIVKFVGPVQGRDRALRLAAADVFVHPSHDEGLPNAVLEAGAAGLPVIATAVGAIPEVYAPPELRAAGEELPLGPLVPPRDPHALAREMKRFAENPELRRRVGSRMTRRFKAEYSIARLAERIAPIYRELLGLPAPTSEQVLDTDRLARRVNAATGVVNAATYDVTDAETHGVDLTGATTS